MATGLLPKMSVEPVKKSGFIREDDHDEEEEMRAHLQNRLFTGSRVLTSREWEEEREIFFARRGKAGLVVEEGPNLDENVTPEMEEMPMYVPDDEIAEIVQDMELVDEFPAENVSRRDAGMVEGASDEESE
jgi:hypothetical protein